MVGNPIRIEGVHSTYRVPPRLHEHTDELVDRPAPEPGQAS
jgi:hypothetical protein